MLYINVVASDVLIYTLEPQIYLGLVRMWASLGLDFSTHSIGHSNFSLFMGNYDFFTVQVWG